MPNGNGRELAEHLSARRPQMKVLYTSGYTSETIARRGLLDAGTAFLHKPFRPDDLARKVREVLLLPPTEPFRLVGPFPGGSSQNPFDSLDDLARFEWLGEDRVVRVNAVRRSAVARHEQNLDVRLDSEDGFNDVVTV
jgi:response regulator RpfG family c-di-GMP phosphodiesterase